MKSEDILAIACAGQSAYSPRPTPVVFEDVEGAPLRGRMEWARMTRAVLDVHALTPGDWQVLRTIRLRALSESACAFTSHYDRESRWSEQQWRHRFDAADWVVAVDRGEMIGIAGLVDGQFDEPQHVESMWVAPSHRHGGVCRSLLEGLAEIARRGGRTELWLWVLEDNTTARRAYERLGFVWTGERQPVAAGQRRRELRMRLAVQS
jgi:ribosomal protein S18 acetylase RimI-like enzyme